MDAAPYLSIPEPPRWGRAGHLPEWLGLDNARSVLERLLEYAEQCGPLARVTLGPVRLLAIADPGIAAEVLADPRANHKGAAYVLTRVVLDNVLLLNGEAWETHRRLYRQALRSVDAVGAARDVTRARAGALARGAEREVMLDDLVWKLVGDVVGRFVAGVELTDDFEPHRHRVQYELAAVGIDLQCQPWTYLDPSRWWKLRRSVRASRAFFRSAVERRMGGGEPRADVLGGFLSLARAGEYPSSADAIQEGVVNVFFTAHDVLASSTAWTLYLLAQRPELQQRLRDRRDPDELRRVVKEGLRLFPGYGLFGRTTQEDMVIGGYHVPRGTLLIVSPFAAHRLERTWKNAKAFDPDRWIGRSAAPPPPQSRDEYLPFGSGARGCLASHLAFPVMETIVRELLDRVELRADPGHDPGISYIGTAYTKRGMPVSIASVSTRCEEAPLEGLG